MRGLWIRPSSLRMISPPGPSLDFSLNSISMLTPCTPKLRQFPGAWPESPSPEASMTSFCDSLHSFVMQATDCPTPTSDLLEEPHRRSSPLGPSRPSRPGGSATLSARKAPPLRIIVPPTEYCPFSTDLTLPITPLSLPTPVSSSCFTFSDTQEIAGQGVSVPPTPGLVLSPCSQDTTVATFPSPTSSQFLLMPPTPHSLNLRNEAAISASPPATPPATNESVLCESNVNKTVNLRPWVVSSSTWLSDLGGYTETDRIFRQNLLEIASVDTHSSASSTPALSLGAASPSSQISCTLANNLANSLPRSPASSPPLLSPYPTSMSSPLSARLALMPTGTDTFPSTFDSLEAWREGVTSGAPRFEEACSISNEEVQSPSPGARLAELVPETAIHSSYHPFPRPPRLSKSQSFIKRAKRFGGRVKQFVSRQTTNKYRGGMDRDVSFRIVTSQDSDNGSVIVISAPPPPYDIRPPTPIPPHNHAGQDYARSRTVSEYSSALRESTLEHATPGVTESSSRRGDNRSALRRLSLAAFSTIKRA